MQKGDKLGDITNMELKNSLFKLTEKKDLNQK